MAQPNEHIRRINIHRSIVEQGDAQKPSYPLKFTKNLVTHLTICALLIYTSYAQAEPPREVNLASQIAVRFIKHKDDSAALRTSAKDQRDIALTDKLKDDSKLSAHLIVAAITSIHIYAQVDGQKRGPALDALKTYLQFTSDELNDRIGSCAWISRHSERAVVIREANGLSSDLQRFREYLELFKRVQPSDVLPESPEGLQKPIL